MLLRHNKVCRGKMLRHSFSYDKVNKLIELQPYNWLGHYVLKIRSLTAVYSVLFMQLRWLQLNSRKLEICFIFIFFFFYYLISPWYKKWQQQTTGLIQRLSNNAQLLWTGVIVSEKFCFRKCLFVVDKFALHGQQFSCQTGKGNRVKHLQF